MQCNTASVVTDPKGENLRDTGRLLLEKGYEVRVLDFINMEKSHCYNPLVYLKDDNDVQKLVTNLFKATTPKNAQPQDPFWDTAASMLLLALIFYLKYEAPEEKQNFAMVMEMLRYGSVSEEDEEYISPLDSLFYDLEMREPEHIAVKYYKNYHSGAGKTLKSIQITLAARLEKFNLESLANLTRTDELDLSRLGKKKIAIFALIPDNDTSFNFLVSIPYTQLFQLFEKEWESIAGNCDSYLYLGGNEQSTHEYVSKLLGKETIDLNTYGKSAGRNGNYSTNYQISGRELLTPDEVRKLDNRYALLFIRGENPIMDFKYDILKHPNVKKTTDGGEKPFVHGKASESIASVLLRYTGNRTEVKEERTLSETDYEVLTEEELE